MKCRLTKDVIEGFYKSEITNELYNHIEKCIECRTTFEVMKKFDLFEFSLKPSKSTENFIISYAVEKIEKMKERDFCRYFKKLSISFLLACSVFMFIFLPNSFNASLDIFENKLNSLETEASLIIYSYYDDISFDFLDN